MFIPVMKRIILMCLPVIVASATAGTPAVKAQQKAEIISHTVIAKQADRYIGWPSIARTAENELLAVFSGDRDEHVCPWGKTQMARSIDNGRTWSPVETVNNTPLDDRDAGIIVTARNTVIVSWFTSLAFAEERYIKHYPEEVTKSWRRHTEKLSDEIRDTWLGCWVRRSTDGGKTWGDHLEIGVNSPHGPIQLSDGRLLYAGKALWNEKKELVVKESLDDGVTWRRTGAIPIPGGESLDHYHEVHAVENNDGTIIALIRFHASDISGYFMQQSESHDGGKTWTVAHSTGVWGYPPHLLKLSDGRIVVVYGHRREPYGEYACVSYDGGMTWDADNPIMLAPAMNGDLGYPASVELDDGSIFTVYYQVDEPGEKTCLMGTRWRLK